MDVEGFDASFSNREYAEEFAKRMNDRLEFIKSRETEKNGIDKLPQDAQQAIENVISQLRTSAAV